MNLKESAADCITKLQWSKKHDAGTKQAWINGTGQKIQK